MIGWHHLVEIEGVEELTLSPLSPPHHRPLPANRVEIQRNHGSAAVSMRVLQHNPPGRGHRNHWRFMSTHPLIDYREVYSSSARSASHPCVSFRQVGQRLRAALSLNPLGSLRTLE